VTPKLQDWSEGVSIVVPTYKRPNGIRIALNSLAKQSAGNRPVEIIVADNDPLASAKNFVSEFAKTCNIEVIYKHVPVPGVSNARNGALDVARGRFIAFLDDDMDALEGWLEELVRVSLKYKAALTFAQEQADRGRKGIPGILRWMIIGGMQLCVYGPTSLVLKALGKPKYIHYQNRTAQALGKIFWWSSFKQELYGTNSTIGMGA